MEQPSNQNNRPVEESRKPDKTPGRNPRRVSPRIWIAVGVAVLLLVCGILIFGRLKAEKAAAAAAAEAEAQALQAQQEQKEQEARQIRYDRIMHSGLYLDGITIEDIPVNGMNRIEARNAIQSVIDAHTPSGRMDLVYEDKTWELDLSGLITVQSDCDEILDRALKAARDEDMDRAFAEADRIAASGQNYTLSFSYRTDALEQKIAGISEEINATPKSAQFINIDKEAHTAEIAGSVTGLEVRQEELLETVMNAVQSGEISSPVQIPVSVTEPAVSGDKLEPLEISFSTSFRGSSENRCFNINKGVDIVNGTLLLPGEVFSMNDTLGTRSASAGWKDANAYVSGATDLQAGGGVCQISTTIFNAAVMADLEIVSRLNHSMPVHYVGMGLDATVNSVGFIIDFQFKNNTPYDVLLFTWTEGKKLCVKIIRCAFQTDEYDSITMTSTQVSVLKPESEMEVIQDDTLKPGESVTEVARRDGSVWQSYKNYFKNGQLVKSEPFYRSTYKAFAGTMRVGPALPESTPAPDTGTTYYDDETIPHIG